MSDSVSKRINHGRGKIHPKNCYLDGQATNYHLNALITAGGEGTGLWLCPVSSNEEIVGASNSYSGIIAREGTSIQHLASSYG